MTDADILDRAAAYEGLTLIGWTPEAVALRMVEAASVVARTPMHIGPKGAQGFWPQVLVVAQDLVDEETQERLMRFPHLVGDWEAHIDSKTRRRMSENKSAEWSRPSQPEAAELSRAEEALRWPALYLADRPLLADALTLWALCIGTGASLRASLRQRVKDADARMRKIGANRRQAAIPGKNFQRQAVHDRRKIAAAVICRALVAGKVAFREAAEGISANSED